jgi:ATP phosphoribosyltransferase
METILKIAVQKKGRLSDKSQELLKACGINFNPGGSQLKARASNFPVEILFLRDDDIPGYVADGVAHLGMVGMNEVDEKAKPVDIVEELGFSKCRISIAVPNSKPYSSIKDLDGGSIATSYPKILQNYLDTKGVKASVHEISGSVEIAPAIGLADGICDIVSTGGTLLSNGLKEVEVIYKSEAVLIGHRDMDSAQKGILEKLLQRIKAVKRAKAYKYILLNAPDASLGKIKELLPGIKSPTVTPLALEGWVAVQTVVREDDFWGITEKLHEVGAEGIIVLPIEKMVY